ncbi:hypothetical protein LCGC14_1050700 [marine sediment metagenome]|uniref:Uncharacterized protein n=1 Tax=marine sediment metagenome TaxID=412755 RepID=A0A0F9QUX4_9ZZZZ
MTTNSTKELKLIHLLWTIMIAVALGGVAWGIMKNELGNQGKDIIEVKEKKVDKNVFEMHLEAQKQQTITFVETVNKGFDRIDKRLENIENK